jgi:HEPN domain-containing protein
LAPPREHAELLLRKASRDEFVFDRLANDPECPDEVLGFHVQQAAEKMLKAALALRRIRHPRTHDLVKLISLLRESGVVVPESLDDLAHLTPYATTFRYDEAEPGGLDRAEARRLLSQCKRWIELQLQSTA